MRVDHLSFSDLIVWILVLLIPESSFIFRIRKNGEGGEIWSYRFCCCASSKTSESFEEISNPIKLLTSSQWPFSSSSSKKFQSEKVRTCMSLGSDSILNRTIQGWKREDVRWVGDWWTWKQRTLMSRNGIFLAQHKLDDRKGKVGWLLTPHFSICIAIPKQRRRSDSIPRRTKIIFPCAWVFRKIWENVVSRTIHARDGGCTVRAFWIKKIW